MYFSINFTRKLPKRISDLMYSIFNIFSHRMLNLFKLLSCSLEYVLHYIGIRYIQLRNKQLISVPNVALATAIDFVKIFHWRTNLLKNSEDIILLFLLNNKIFNVHYKPLFFFGKIPLEFLLYTRIRGNAFVLMQKI